MNTEDRDRCQGCGATVRPSFDEPVRPPDPADIIGRGKKPDSESADG